MRNLVIGRLLQGILVVLGSTVIVFLVIRIIPGDPVRLMGPLATEDNLRTLRHDWGLDLPVPQQFLKFITDAAHGDLGTSMILKQSVASLIASRFPLTLALTFLAMLIALVVAIPLGALSALKRDTIWDRGAMTFAVGVQSMPNFWVALMLLFLVAVSWKLLPGTGYEDPRSLILPAIALSFGLIPVLIRAVRTILIDVLGQDFIKAQRARGLPLRAIVMRHSFKNMSIPLLTILGVQVGYLLGGALVIEWIFNFPGMGLLMLQAVLRRDYPLVQGLAVFIAAVFVVINLIVDLSYGYLDPRIRKQELTRGGGQR
jgi:peptide/nickel transport system permease protein